MIEWRQEIIYVSQRMDINVDKEDLFLLCIDVRGSYKILLPLQMYTLSLLTNLKIVAVCIN